MSRKDIKKMEQLVAEKGKEISGKLHDQPMLDSLQSKTGTLIEEAERNHFLLVPSSQTC